MKRLLSFIVIIFLFLNFLPAQVKATHAAGAELLYEWVSDSTYRIYYKFYRDCVGAAEPTTVPVCYYNSCNSVSGSIILTKLAVIPGNTPNGSEISPGCAERPTTCVLTSSSLPGYREWWYYGTVTLPSRCDKWTFFYGISGRNNAITNLQTPGTQTLYTEATLDNMNAQGNTSPFFSVKPIPYICNGIPYTWNNGAFDRNNDSLAFDMIQPMTGGASGCAAPNATSIPYNNPPMGEPAYNLSTNPFATNNTFNFNHITGVMTFTPSMVQRAAVALRVSEYRYVPGFTKRKLIGTVIRDMQFTVLSCNDVPPILTVNPVTISGATYDGATIKSCAGTPLNFCFKVTSQQANAVLQVTDNSTLMPGMKITYANTSSDSVVACVSWNPSLFDTGLKSLIVTVKDTFCNASGTQVVNTFTIPMNIEPSVSILTNVGICPGDSAQMMSYGGGGFVWDVLPGGSPLSSLSCTNCQNPIAKPTVTTRYTLFAQLSNACSNRDTATVFVGVPIAEIGDTTVCINNPVQMNVSFPLAPPNIQYAIKWTPSTYLSNDAIANPIMNASQDIQYIVAVASISNVTCATLDTVRVRVLQGYTIYNANSVTCNGAPIQVIGNGDSRYTYAWSPSGGVSKANILVPKIITDTPVIYRVTASYPGCRDSVTKFYIDTSCAPPANGIYSTTINSSITLLQNYPNPFTNETVIPFVLDELSDVTIDILDMVGRNIMTIQKADLEAGQQQVVINANRIGLVAGNYIYRVEVSNEKGLFRQSRIMFVQ